MELNFNVKLNLTEEGCGMMNDTVEEFAEYFRSELEEFLCEECASEIKAGLLEINVTRV